MSTIYSYNTHIIPRGHQYCSQKYQLISADTVDLLVGAEGTWRKVRNLLSFVKLVYAGMSTYEIEITDAGVKAPSVVKLCGQGMAWIVHDGKGIVIQRNLHGNLRAYVGFQVDEGWLQAGHVRTHDPQLARKDLLALFSAVRSDLLDVLCLFDDNWLVPRAYYALPIGFTRTTKPGVTLIGDAAHGTSPYAGEGVNQALADADEHAAALITLAHSHPSGVSPAAMLATLQRFERAMQQRVRPCVVEADRNLHLFHRSPRHWVYCLFRMFLPRVVSWLLAWGWEASVRLSK